jgi:two-component system OmpR family response regulator
VIDREGVSIDLTGGEFDLLLCLVTHPQRVLNRDQLLDWTRGRSANAFDRAVDVQLSRLRRKLAKRSGGDVLIKTVRGGGYQFTERVERL